jgi:hypothetical protein
VLVGLGLEARALELTLELELRALRCRGRVGLDLRDLGLASCLDELRLRATLDLEHLVHDLSEVSGEDQILHVGAQDLDAVAARRAGHVLTHGVRDLVAVRQDVAERTRGQEATRRQLHVLVDALLVRRHAVHRRLGVDDLEVDEQRDADRGLVGGQDLLTLDGHRALAQIDDRHASRDGAAEPLPERAEVVAAGAELTLERAVLVEQADVGLGDGDVVRHGDTSPCGDGERSSGASALGESKDALGWDAQP